MTITKSKLSKLDLNLRAGGYSDSGSVLKVLGFSPSNAEAQERYEAYMDALVEAHPSVYARTDDDDGVNPKTYEVLIREAESSEGKKHFLRNENGTLTELEVVADKKGKVVLSIPVKKDLVKILIGGEIVEIDLEKLRADDFDTIVEPYGLRSSQLLAAGELAKA